MAALIEAKMGDLLIQLGESITGRARVPVQVSVFGECALSPDVKIAMYRIAQESLNNVAKHSGASKAEVWLECKPGHVSLRITDNGKGFSVSDVSAQSLGTGIMRERAAGIGAKLVINSKPGQGTEISLEWNEPGEGKHG